MRAASLTDFLLGRSSSSRIFFGSLLLLLLILARWLWIDCDGGTPSLAQAVMGGLHMVKFGGLAIYAYCRELTPKGQ